MNSLTECRVCREVKTEYLQMDCSPICQDCWDMRSDRLERARKAQWLEITFVGHDRHTNRYAVYSALHFGRIGQSFATEAEAEKYRQEC